MPKKRNPAEQRSKASNPHKRNPAAQRSKAPGPRSKASVRKQAMSRRSPDRMRERSQWGSGYGRVVMPRGGYDPITYSKPDVASLGDPPSPYQPWKRKAQDIEPDPSWRHGEGYSRDYENPNVPVRRMAFGGYQTGSSGAKRRAASTEAAFRIADASMTNPPE